MSDAEARFEAENGMSAGAAWDYIQRWQQEGKTEQVRRGCEELLKFFPDHAQARQLLDEITRPHAHNGDAEQQVPGTPLPEKKPGMLDGLMGKVKHTVNQQRQKLEEMNPPQSKDSQNPQDGLPGVSQPTDAEKLLGAVCYLYIFVIIPLLMKRDSQFVQFHAWQGVVLTAGMIGLNILFGIISSPFQFSGGMMTGLLNSLESIFRLVVVLIYIWGAHSAYHGKWKRIPIVYPFAEKFRRAVQ